MDDRARSGGVATSNADAKCGACGKRRMATQIYTHLNTQIKYEGILARK